MGRHAAALASAAPSSRYLDKGSNRWVVKVLPGGQHISQQDGELIATVLGSCVAACLHDPIAGIGGMNHFMLPHDDEGLWSGASLALRYGNHAMDALINELLKAGADKRRLECKFFGGGNVMNGMRGVGDQNAAFAREYARVEGLKVIAVDLGGDRGRRVMYDPATGKAWRRFIQSSGVGELVKTERQLRAAPPLRKQTGSIELF
ncbi:chemotaxis protein CheD [Maricaulis sp.]|uniref:chemotaxis protein CheD n=1 Tax=Maricaulis sp. TaxID=1486257 RepID=UPI0025BC878D|nr:chemotaxis protein CheD [Maricaulis sp.]